MNYYEIAMQISQWTQQVVNHAMWCGFCCACIFSLFHFFSIGQSLPFDSIFLSLSSIQLMYIECAWAKIIINIQKIYTNTLPNPNHPVFFYANRTHKAHHHHHHFRPPFLARTRMNFIDMNTRRNGCFLYFDHSARNFLFMPSQLIHFN